MQCWCMLRQGAGRWNGVCLSGHLVSISHVHTRNCILCLSYSLRQGIWYCMLSVDIVVL